MLWSYFMTAFTDPGRVPAGWRPWDVPHGLLGPPASPTSALGRAGDDGEEADENEVLLSSSSAAAGVGGGGGAAGYADDRRAALLCEEGPSADAGPSGGGGDGKEPSPKQFFYAGREIRYCTKCRAYKPQRSHHCSVCGRCVLKMDHHCGAGLGGGAGAVGMLSKLGNRTLPLSLPPNAYPPHFSPTHAVWVATCAGALNYKFFLLFLWWALLLSSFAAASLFPAVHGGRGAGGGGGGGLAGMAFVCDVVFSLTAAVFLLMHARLLLNNLTTIEQAQQESGSPSESAVGGVRPEVAAAAGGGGGEGWGALGRRNFEEVFGEEPLLWLLPVHGPAHLRRLAVLSGLEPPPGWVSNPGYGGQTLV